MTGSPELIEREQAVATLTKLSVSNRSAVAAALYRHTVATGS